MNMNMNMLAVPLTLQIKIFQPREVIGQGLPLMDKINMVQPVYLNNLF